MKKLIQISKLTLCVLTNVSLLSSDLVAEEGVALIPKVSTTPVVDGEIDTIYHASGAFYISTVQNGTVEDATDCSAIWYGVYDAQRLYFIVDISDQSLVSNSGGASWQQDIIEVYFNMDNVKPGGGNGHSGDNYQYHFGWNVPNGGTVSSNGSFANVQWVQVTTSKGWRIEASIPWASLGIASPSENQEIGFDIAVNDNDGNTSYDSVMYWYNSAGALYGNIDGAGTIVMGGDFDGNYRPEIDDLDVQVATEGVASSITLTATDVNSSDALTFGAVGLPSFANLVDNGNGTASININAATGDANIYRFEASVNDGKLTDTKEIILIVKDPKIASQLPAFDVVGTVSVQEGSLETITIVVTDLDSLEVVISAGSTLPDFVSLTDNGDKTATLSVNPGFGKEGSYTAELLATDEDDNIDTLSVSIVVTSGVVQTEFYCDPVNGNMSNAGSMESPWSSLEAVFAAGKLFKPGDTIYLLSGYHGEPSIAGSNTDYVYIKPVSGAKPTFSKITFEGNSAYWNLSGATVSRSFAPTYSLATMVGISGQYNIVADCDIYSVDDISNWEINDWLAYASTGTSVGGYHCMLKDSTIRNIKWGAFVGGTYATLSGCKIQNYSGDGARATGDYCTIEDCTILDNYKVDSNHDDGIQSYSDGPGGAGSGVVKGVTLRRNTIIQTTDLNRPLQGGLQGIGCFDGMFEDWVVENNVVLVGNNHGIALYGAINCKIANNTVLAYPLGSNTVWITIEPHKNYDSRGPDPDLNAYYLGSGNLVRNNLVTFINDRPSVGTFDHNVMVGGGNINTYFVDYPNDLRLKANSPAINAGFNADAPSDDITGATRLSGSNTIVDVGAYEANVSTWNGWPITDGIYVDTGNYLGWLAIGRDPWIYNYNIEGWIYFNTFPDPNGVGVWGYFKR